VARFTACLLLVFLPGGAQTALRPGTRNVFYSTQTEDAWVSLQANAAKIAVVAPQVLAVDASGSVRGRVESRVRALAAEQGLEVMPVLFNDDFSPAVAHAVLSDESRRRRVVSEAVRLCLESECAGLQLDFEGMAPEDFDGYVALARELASALHQRQRYFSVAVASPLFTGSRPLEDYRTTFGGFVVFPALPDLRELGRHADFLTLMAYDHYGRSAPPGPVAGYPWVEQSIRFVTQHVPAAKLSLGIPFYGRRWCWQEVSEMSYTAVQTLLKITNARVNRHPWQRAPNFEFELNGCRNIVFYEDRQSLQEKLRLVRRYRLPGISAWRLGQEDPAFWGDVPPARRTRYKLVQ
jgi:spore germination protein YaaH